MTAPTWIEAEWGELATLEYGRALRDYRASSGSTTVYGTNGRIGSSDVVPQSAGPGVIIGRKGAYRGVHFSPGKFFVIDTAFWLKPKSPIDLRWAYYELLTHDINSMDSGSAIPSTSRDAFYRMPVLMPPIEEQQGVADALGALDDKIESNERAIFLLEQLGAVLLGSRLRTGPTGTPVADSRPLNEFIRVLETGSRPRGGLKADTVGTVSLGAQHVQSAGVCKAREFKHIPNDFVASMRHGRLEDGDVLVYKDGGKPGNFVPHVSAFGYGFPVHSAVINEHVYRVRAADGVSQALLYWVLRSPWLDEEMRKRGTGVAIPGLNSSNFRELPFPELRESDSVFLNEMLSPMLEEILRLGAENVRIATLRDTLLPELLSGRIRIRVGEIDEVLA